MRWIAPAAVILAAAACAAPSGSSPAASSAATPRGATPAIDAAWEIVGRAPFERIETAAAAHDGRIWLVGGLNADGSATDEAWIFDPGDGSWNAGPSLPEQLHHAALVSTGEDLLLIGGYRGASFSTPVAAVRRLSPTGTGWDELGQLPEARAAGAAAWDGERVIYAGGTTPGQRVSDTVWAFDASRWSTVGTMFTAREHFAAASDGAGRVWLLGGRLGSLESSLATIEYVEGSLVTRVGELPTLRGGAAAFHVPGIGACLSGGELPGEALAVVECIGPDLAIVGLPPMPEPRHGHAAAILDGTVYVFLGGPQPLLTVSDTVMRLELPAD